MRLRPHSLQGRMLMLSAVAMLVALSLAGWAVAVILERVVVEGLDRRLDSEVALLASTIDADGKVDRARLDQQVGAFEAGPGWQWQIVAPSGTIGSDDFPSLRPLLPRPPRPEPFPVRRPDDDSIIRPLDGHEREGMPVHARRLTLHTRGGDVMLTVAAPREIVSRPIRAALAPLLAVLAVLAVLLAGATLVQLRLGLRPLRRMRDQVAALRAGRQVEIDEEQPSELRPLATELNALSRENAAALDAARLSAANLAHALKTPVATLALDLRDEPERGAQVARIEATIRHHLSRTRTAANRRSSTRLAPAVEGVVDAVRRLNAQRALAFEVAIDPELAVAVDATDLDEMIGNLVDNAARFAQTSITVTANGGAARTIVIDISDDGPGIAADLRGRLPRPGVRLDERGDGYGLGLSIVAELASLYGGTLTLGTSAGGGLLASVALPGSS